VKTKSIVNQLEQGTTVDSFIERIKNGDTSFLKPLLEESRTSSNAKLRQLVDRIAGSPQIVNGIGDLRVQAQASWGATYGDQRLAQEAVRNKAVQESKAVAGAHPTPLEMLLAENIALCGLHYHYIETKFAQRVNEGLSFDAIRGYQNWIDRAHRRYMSAVKTLALVRKLGLPTVQVNVAEKQVNVGQIDVANQPGGRGDAVRPPEVEPTAE
jgi:hypothetical protein